MLGTDDKKDDKDSGVYNNNNNNTNNNNASLTVVERELRKILKNLLDNLRVKASQYPNNKITLQCIFIINNIHYIVKSITDTPLEAACGKAEIEELRKDLTLCKNKYIKHTWAKTLDFITFPNNKDPFTSKKTGLKISEKRPIKKRFEGFNRAFLEQLTGQRSYSVPDTLLRAELENKHSTTVLPQYRTFLNRIQDVEFASDKGKYLKYDDKQIESLIHQFFEENS